MEPDLSGTAALAAACLRRHVGESDLPGAADRILRMLQGFEGAVAGVDAAGETRGAGREHARFAVGSLLGFGVPWTEVLPLLDGLDDPAVPRTAPLDASDPSLAWDHFLAYEIARTHLWALGWTTPAASVIDYWGVLEALDASHGPSSRPPVAMPPVLDHALHHAAARAAVDVLAAFDLDNRVLPAVRDRLEREWEHDRTGRAGDGA